MFVKTIEEIRRENLASLVAWAGGVVKLGVVIGKSQSQISQILKGSPDTKSKTAKPKEMGSKVARHIEVKCKKERGWMDHEAADQEAQVFKQLPAEVRAWILKNAEVGALYSKDTLISSEPELMDESKETLQRDKK